MVLVQGFLVVNHEIPKTFTGDFFEEWKEFTHSPNSHKKLEEHLRLFFNSKFQSFLPSYKKVTCPLKQGLQKMSYVVETTPYLFVNLL